MKKRRIKFFVHTLALCALVLLACSKSGTSNPAPSPGDSTNPVSPYPEGISTQKTDTKGGNVSDYLLYIPPGYNEKKNYRWPVVFFLHGVGEMGSDVNVLREAGLMKVAAGKPFIIVAPQCRKGWWNPAVLEYLYKEVRNKYNVDTNRIYLTGMSMGGYGTWDWSSSFTGRFAAIVPICGGGSVSAMVRLKSTPVWAFHSANDSTVAVTETRALVQALKDLGGNVKYTEYPDGGHDAWTRTYANPDVYTWLLQQHF
ncbi:MAG TPA: dienelactone hydrolase family protein [Chitinophaga sp.]|uniref:carboxylesterase family protein n=1 Tax=Chitinophaga sp. TaxID=1869181 RepID=UPI002C1F67BB|nr:dienelactone hydrolase family protein [Chitinophaga sp.]HVI49445.1 dienelactone hydrolase family protein [Chitinophaga sp.]